MNQFLFEDGTIISDFINNSIERYQYLKEVDVFGKTSFHGMMLISRYNEINIKYGFNVTIKSIKENTFYYKVN